MFKQFGSGINNNRKYLPIAINLTLARDPLREDIKHGYGCSYGYDADKNP